MSTLSKRYCLIVLHLILSSSYPPASSYEDGSKNRSNLFSCYQCRGSRSWCHWYNPFKKSLSMCVKPTEACYTMVQQEDGTTNRIVSRGCGHIRYCQFAKQIKLYNLKHCDQCQTDLCNGSWDFAYEELDADNQNQNLAWRGVAHGLLVLIAQLLTLAAREYQAFQT